MLKQILNIKKDKNIAYQHYKCIELHYLSSSYSLIIHSSSQLTLGDGLLAVTLTCFTGSLVHQEDNYSQALQ